MSSFQQFDRPTATRELRALVEELDQRIARQQRRVEKSLFDRQPTDALQAALADMVKSREFMLSQLLRFESEEALVKSPEPSRDHPLKTCRLQPEHQLATRVWAELAIIEQGNLGIVRHLQRLIRQPDSA